MDNLIANGDEPFVSIRKPIAAVYGNNAQHFFVLAVPPATHRFFNFTTVSVEYRGLLIGSVVTANKIRPADSTTYGYRPLQDAFLAEYEDVPC